MLQPSLSNGAHENITMNIDKSKRRELAIFLLGPAALTLVTATIFRVYPWPVPLEAQGKLLGFAPASVILALAVLGLMCARRAGVPDTPALSDGAIWKKIFIATVPLGLFCGALLLAADVFFGFTSAAVSAIDVSWVHVPLPESLLHYSAGAVLLECLYRLIPLPILTWLISGVLMKGRAREPVFWALAVLTSLFEPAGFLAVGGINLQLATLLVFVFGVNLVEAAHYKRFGWSAPLIFRLALYLVWHCVGPYLLPADSMLYPGMR